MENFFYKYVFKLKKSLLNFNGISPVQYFQLVLWKPMKSFLLTSSTKCRFFSTDSQQHLSHDT